MYLLPPSVLAVQSAIHRHVKLSEQELLIVVKVGQTVAMDTEVKHLVHRLLSLVSESFLVITSLHDKQVMCSWSVPGNSSHGHEGSIVLRCADSGRKESSQRLPKSSLSNSSFSQRGFRTEELKKRGETVPEEYLPHITPLGWGHINLIGQYSFSHQSARSLDNLRPLRLPDEADQETRKIATEDRGVSSHS